MRRVAWVLAATFIAALMVLIARRHSTRVALDDAEPAAVLLFNGTGTSPNDVASLEALLSGAHIRYATASSAALDEMSPERLRRFQLILIPGGNFEIMGNGLRPATTARLRAAVNAGVSYLGVCAGAFLAGSSPYNGIDLTGGKRFPFYSAEARGVRKAALVISMPGGDLVEHYWEDGPQLDGWGAPIARYPDGTAAVVQGRSGEGWVVLAGIHPEAPESWREGLPFHGSAAKANAFALELIDAALHRRPLPEL